MSLDILLHIDDNNPLLPKKSEMHYFLFRKRVKISFTNRYCHVLIFRVSSKNIIKRIMLTFLCIFFRQ